MRSKKIMSLLMAVVLGLSSLMLAGCGCSVNTDTTQPEEKVTPTFMYFVSAKDADYEATNKVLDELQTKYADKINFTIINIDEDSEALKNFPLVENNTPALIMLNTSNDISAMEFQCGDKAKLEEDIKNALK